MLESKSEPCCQFFEDWSANIIIEDALETSLENRKEKTKLFESMSFVTWVKDHATVRIYLGKQAGHTLCGMFAMAKYFTSPLIITSHSDMSKRQQSLALRYGIELPKMTFSNFFDFRNGKLQNMTFDSLMIDPASDGRIIAQVAYLLSRNTELFKNSPEFTILMVGG